MSYLFLNVKRATARFLVFILALSQILVFMPQSAAAAKSLPPVVISEIQTGPGTNEFIELYNPADDPMALDGWKLRYKSATGSSVATRLTFGSGVRIDAKKYLLIAGSGYAGRVAGDTVSVDDEGDEVRSVSLGLSSDGGHVILVAADGLEVDRVGYGPSADSPEGQSANAPADGQSIERKPGSFNGNGQDTNNNRDDFIVRTTPTPQNSESDSTPTAPPAPSGLTGVCADEAVELEWNSLLGALNYQVFVDGRPSGEPTEETRATVTGLSNGQSYRFAVAARNLYGELGAVSSPVVVTPCEPLQAQVLALEGYAKYVKDGSAGSLFSSGEIDITVSLKDAAALEDGEKLSQLSISSPLTDTATTIGLDYNWHTDEWQSQSKYVIASDSQNGDRHVTVATTFGRTVTLLGNSDVFRVDTRVSPVKATLTSRCSVKEDSFSAKLDSDVVSVWIYRDSSLSSASLIAVAPVTDAAMAETFIGDNLFSELWLVAKDLAGNASPPVRLINDIQGPVAPTASAVAQSGGARVSWAPVSDAKSYRVSWQTAQGNTATSDVWDTSVFVPSTANITVQSIDEYCNVGPAASVAVSKIVYSVPRVSAAERESAVLAEAGKVNSSKDDATISSSDKADAESDTNGAKSGGNDVTTVKDRSSLVVTIAILLILAGIAIAVYSWSRDESGDSSDEKNNREISRQRTESNQRSPRRTAGAKGRRSKNRDRWS